MRTDKDGSSVFGTRRPLFSRIGLLLLIALCVLFVSSYTSRLVRKAHVEQEITEWEQSIAAAEQRQLELEAELDYVNSSAYIEERAREELGMGREGDTVIIVVASTEVPEMPVAMYETTVDKTSSGSASPAEPTWRQWMMILVGEK
jgi:cell division protein FtsB